MILQVDPHAGYREDKALVDAAVLRVLDSGQYIMGQEVEAFEAEFAAYIGVRHGIAVANGTQAVEIALRSVGVGSGDLVLTVSHTAVATVTAIRSCGAEPVWVDVAEGGFTMDVGLLDETAATLRAGPDSSRLKAVVAVHLYGAMVPPEALLEVCRRHGLKLVEDCAQAHGAAWNGKRAGSFGDASAFSFYPTKNLGALGDGGMVCTGDDGAAEQARLIRQYGWKERYVSAIEGINSRLDPVQAAILRIGLTRLDERNARRRAIAALYDEELAGTAVATPAVAVELLHAYHQYVVRTAGRDGLAARLRAEGVGSGIHYPVPVHAQPAYRGGFDRHCRTLRNTEALAGEILSLPMYPQLAHDNVRRVAGLIRQFQGS
ncbi:DegT/DnrJ/EryC1/StrS family aminotransferase [Azospirillum soli]|uniref:DegT/DnrJ/EryC1/StrS family aminotransferase n=1 Tax=Azospirillum soli TaxID=1304799 RepID=UPI001AE4F524|nr:DegT/DnrJ/EryC1/StrS family aminotransferase [Azospirillum soli]MBP2316565.1 dTDP-4-amino-4,6-dideoxygalactose transaminase [Azospirillum soli]